MKLIAFLKSLASPIKGTFATGQPQPIESTSPMHTYKVFCCGETGADSVEGTLETMVPLVSGHIHTIEGKQWRCDWVDKNTSGHLIANFRAAVTPSATHQS